jgi:hypothetical protein
VKEADVGTAGCKRIVRLLISWMLDLPRPKRKRCARRRFLRVLARAAIRAIPAPGRRALARLPRRTDPIPKKQANQSVSSLP